MEVVLKEVLWLKEELFRKTDYALHKSEHLYPLKMNEFVFTQNVSIIKDGQYNDIPLNNIFMVDMLAIAAIYNPVLIDDKYSTKDYKIMCEKIDTIFRFAIYNGYTYLNLGALGCGAYNNPPQQVVEIYNIYLKKYDKYFDTIANAEYIIPLIYIIHIQHIILYFRLYQHV